MTHTISDDSFRTVLDSFKTFMEKLAAAHEREVLQKHVELTKANKFLQAENDALTKVVQSQGLESKVMRRPSVLEVFGEKRKSVYAENNASASRRSVLTRRSVMRKSLCDPRPDSPGSPRSNGQDDDDSYPRRDNLEMARKLMMRSEQQQSHAHAPGQIIPDRHETISEHTDSELGTPRPDSPQSSVPASVEGPVPHVEDVRHEEVLAFNAPVVPSTSPSPLNVLSPAEEVEQSQKKVKKASFSFAGVKEENDPLSDTSLQSVSVLKKSAFEEIPEGQESIGGRGLSFAENGSFNQNSEEDDDAANDDAGSDESSGEGSDEDEDPFESDIDIVLLETWEAQARSLNCLQAAAKMKRGTSKNLKSSSRGGLKVVSNGMFRRFLQPWVTSPTSWPRVIWDLFALSMVLFSLVWLPLQAFQPPRTVITNALELISAAYWTLDILAWFLVGYNTNGVINKALPSIARHYARTWFLYDVALVVADYTSHFSGLRELQLVLLLRAVRLYRANGLSVLSQHIQSEATRIVLGICKLLAFIVIGCHMVACSWFFIGVYGDQSVSWVKAYNFEREDRSYQYSTSLHWSLTQLTPASMEVNAQNTLERLFTILVVISAMVTFSSFVSAITGATNQLQRLNRERAEHLAKMRQLCVENKIPVHLVTRTNSCLLQALTHEKHRLHVQDVAAIKYLPQGLQEDLMDAVYCRATKLHYLFRKLTTNHAALTAKLHANAFEDLSVPREADVFVFSQEATKMFFVMMGSLAYSQGPVQKDSAETVGKGTFIGEPCLWVDWNHVGILSNSTSYCELVALDSQRLAKVVLTDPACTMIAYKYAREMAKWLQEENDYGHISDLPPPHETIRWMVSEALKQNDLDNRGPVPKIGRQSSQASLNTLESSSSDEEVNSKQQFVQLLKSVIPLGSRSSTVM
eukprot:TRINITY_DN82511_c0_g1_i1.p1 TRINITY_DN82511_c0_g1~~TRINITY_DN82511_c0_g1_i1.p1  ORF type:complete len:918 (-),score=156.58 TRINITY_DN82511_c0_g1_i1:28-2781(-)